MGKKTPKKGSSASQRVYDISSFPLEDLIDIDICNAKFDGDLYISKLDSLNGKCSRGGTSYNLKPTTFDDEEHPGCIIRLSGSWLEKDVTTAFFILKRDIYNSGYCHDCKNDNFLIGRNWRSISGSLVTIEGSVQGCFIDCLYNLKYGIIQSPNLLEISFHSVSHHLCEGARLTAVSKLICQSFNSNENSELGDLRDLFNKWSKLSKVHRNVWLGRQKEAENGMKNKDFAKLGLTSFESVEKALKIMLMENEGERVVRRQQLAQKNKSVLKYYKKALYTKLEKREPCWYNVHRVTWNELKEAREERLKLLMDSGEGEPDIWRALYESLREPEVRYAKYKVQNSNVNLKRRDISRAIDDNGANYKFKKGFMLCDPIDGCERSKKKLKTSV